MPSMTFPSLYARASRRGKCPNCGKSVTRSRTFEQTVNPWNRHPDGTPLTTDEVQVAVRAKADAWAPDFTHCKPEEA